MFWVNFFKNIFSWFIILLKENKMLCFLLLLNKERFTPMTWEEKR